MLDSAGQVLRRGRTFLPATPVLVSGAKPQVQARLGEREGDGFFLLLSVGSASRAANAFLRIIMIIPPWQAPPLPPPIQGVPSSKYFPCGPRFPCWGVWSCTNASFHGPCLKTPVVGRARATRSRGVWPRAVTASAGTTMVRAAWGACGHWGISFALIPDTPGPGPEPRRGVRKKNEEGRLGRQKLQGANIHFPIIFQGLNQKSKIFRSGDPSTCHGLQWVGLWGPASWGRDLIGDVGGRAVPCVAGP